MLYMSATKRQRTPIDLNDEFRRALDIMERTDKSVFITGRAGTGKSTLLTYFRQNTFKKVAVLAPTGVAALNVKGQTIHSFFKFKPDITLEKVKRVRFSDDSKNVYKKLDMIIIDEVSMVRADLLDCVDKFLRLNGPRKDKPFGGIQMAFIGDLYQLPPVVTSVERKAFQSLYETPYFFSAKVFDSFPMEIVELQKVYRQRDEDFIGLLNSIRNNSITDQGLELLNRRCLPTFTPPSGELYVYLTTTNDLASRINEAELAKLRNKPRTFVAQIEGDFGREYLPTSIELRVKVGAQVMMLNNDAAERWVNGSIGKITDIVENDKGEAIVVNLADGETVEVTPYTWEIFRFFAEGGQLQSEIVGKFTQYPLMLAWAVTVHKSQGKTFNMVVIDFGRGTFVNGQAYVALSRCTSLAGIVFKQPLQKKHIWTDYRVMKFMTGFQYEKAEEAHPADDKVTIIKRAIENKTALEIIYLKPDDEKSKRTVLPESIGEMSYHGKTYLGMRAFCLLRHEMRTFRVDRILGLSEARTV